MHFVRRFIPPLVHASLVLFLCGSLSAALGFFGVSAGLVLLRRFVPIRLRALYVFASVVLLVVLLLVYRDSPALAWADGDSLLRLNLTFLGVSYAFLRVVRALLDPRPWRAAEYLHYYFFFPTFFSGPILEPRDMPAELRWHASDLRLAAARILDGLIRIGGAHLLREMVPLGSSQQLAWSASHWPAGGLWLGAFASGVWLYLNFSGFTEVYIGLARACGVRAPENFDRPFAATDLTAFWQRWHMTLGSWLRTTIYAPISRRLLSSAPGAGLPVAALVPVVTMLLCGAWHQVAPAMLVWGGLHGVGLGAHVLWRRFASAYLPGLVQRHAGYRAAGWLVTHGFVAFSWVFFLPVDPAVSFDDRLRLAAALLGVGGAP